MSHFSLSAAIQFRQKPAQQAGAAEYLTVMFNHISISEILIWHSDLLI
jgi:hypothetical protein